MRTQHSPNPVLLIAAAVTAACTWQVDPPRPPSKWRLSGRGWSAASGYDIGFGATIDGSLFGDRVNGKADIRRLHTPAGKSVDIKEFVPPGADTDYYCLSFANPDSRDSNLLLFVRDTGDGWATFDEVMVLGGPGARCKNFPSLGDKQFTPLDGGDYEAGGSEHPGSAAAFPWTKRHYDRNDRPCFKCGPHLWELGWRDPDYLSVTDPEQRLRIRLYDTFATHYCGGDSEDPRWTRTRAARAAGDSVSLIDQEQEVPIVVYPLRQTGYSDRCEHLQRDWIYQGKGTARVTDDNVYWHHGSGGHNTYAIVISGTVQDSAGNRYTVSGTNRYVLDGLCCFTGGNFVKSNFIRPPRNFEEGRPRYVPPEDEDWELVRVEETIVLHRIEAGND